MIAKPWNIPSYLYDREIDIDERLGIFFLDLGIVAGVLGAILCAFTHAPWYGVLVPALMAVAATIVMVIGFLTKHTDNIGILIAILLPAFMFFTWIWNGGSSGGVNVWYIYVLFFIVLFASKKELPIYLAYALIVMVGSFVFEYFFPQCVYRFTVLTDAYISIIGSIVIVGAAILIAVIVQKDLYEREKRAGDKKEQSTIGFVTSVANIVDAKDRYTSSHSRRVAICARELGRQLGLPETQVNQLYVAGMLHDIGKIGIPDAILNKPGRLTDYEYDIMKRHSVIGGTLLADIDYIDYAHDVALHHHERWDGKGYPDGLAGEDIPYFARIMAVADSYDAMSMNRVYRPKLSPDVIHDEFVHCSGSQFDPEIADVFVGMLERGFKIDDTADATPSEVDLSLEAEKLLQYIVTDRMESAELEANLTDDKSENADEEGGAVIVRNTDFVSSYRYLSGLGQRLGCSTDLVHIEVVPVEDAEIDPAKMAHAVDVLDGAIQQNIRRVDVCTRFGAYGYLVIFLNAHIDGVDVIMHRVSQSFYNVYGENDVTINHSVIS